jgi:probable phosphoglycerate mutase
MIVQRRRADELSFFRHGETKYNQKKLVSGQHDTMLSARGRSEAAFLSDKLQKPISLLACSALTRAIETMELSVPSAVRSTVPIVIDRRLNEVNLGVLQGRKAEFIQQFADGDLDWAPAGGESYKEAARRVFSAVVDLFDRLAEIGSAPRSGAVFCHAGVMRIIGTLIDEHSESRNVFKSSAKNLECLAISTTRLRLPAFWRGGNENRGQKRDLIGDSRG